MSKRKWDEHTKQSLQHLCNQCQWEINDALSQGKGYRDTANTVRLYIVNYQDFFPQTRDFKDKLNTLVYELDNVRLVKSRKHLQDLWWMLNSYKGN